jgi:hypothetical protein
MYGVDSAVRAEKNHLRWRRVADWALKGGYVTACCGAKSKETKITEKRAIHRSAV